MLNETNSKQGSTISTLVSGHANIHTSFSIAYDWVHDHIYWTNRFMKKVSVAFANGSYTSTVVNCLGLTPHAIALHPKKG